MSHVTCHVSHVTCHETLFFSSSIFFLSLYKVVKLVGGGSVINRATPSGFFVLSLCFNGVDFRAVKYHKVVRMQAHQA